MKKNNIIKVVFLLRKNSPLNLKSMEYFVDTDNYVVADKKATEQLKLDLIPTAKRFNETIDNIIRYYGNVLMSEINLIGNNPAIKVKFKSRSHIVGALVRCDNWEVNEAMHDFAIKHQDSNAELNDINGLMYIDGCDIPVPRCAYFKLNR